MVMDEAKPDGLTAGKSLYELLSVEGMDKAKADELLIHAKAAVKAIQKEAFDTFKDAKDSKKGLNHRDANPFNFKFTADGKKAAILDWGLATWGTTVCDLRASNSSGCGFG